MGLRITLPTLRGRLFSVGLLGALLGLIVLWTAVTEFGHVHRSDRRAAQLSLAQRSFQDADQAHDALHADVSEALRVAGQPDAVRARAVLDSDAEVFQRNLDRVLAVPLPADVVRGLQQLRPVQVTYLQSARRIGLLSVTAPGQAAADLSRFDDDFLRLQKAQGEVTNQLAAAEEATKSSAERVQNGAERRIVITAVLALIGLLTLALLLQRAGARVQRANAQLAAQLARERRIAETLQRSLLPKQLPELHGAALAARFLPTEEGSQVGGDWYDAIRVSRHGLVLVIGDVVGHDIAAAAMMGQLRPAMRSLALEGLDPGEVLTRLNHQLLEFDPDQSATCVLATLDEVTRRISFANAGHCPPLLLTAAGAATFLEATSCPPLGAVVGLTYPTQTAGLNDGDTLLLYTDGLVERRDTGLEDGLARLTQAAEQASAASPGEVDPDDLCDRVMAYLFENEKPTDDVAMLALTRTRVPARHRATLGAS